MLRIKPAVSLIFIFAGTLDWLTTVIGVTYFNAIETNSIIASIANTNLPAFAALKLAITLFAGTFFYLAEYALTQPENIKIRTYRYAHTTLKTACIAVTALLLIATLNNFIVIANAL